MNNLIPASDFLADKKKTVEDDLKQAKPLIIASTKEGILLITENPTHSNKIAEAYDRIAFGAIGKYVKFKKLRKMIVSQAIIIGGEYAREDVRVESLTEALGDKLDEIDSISLYKTAPWSVEIALAEVNSKPEHDKIVVILFNGVLKYKDQPYVVVGRNKELKVKIEELTQEKKFKEMNFKESIRLIKKAIIATLNRENKTEDKKNKKGKEKRIKPDVKFEIAVLHRDKPGKKFQRIIEQRRGI